MTWSDVISNWDFEQNRLLARYPHVTPYAANTPPKTMREAAHYLAGAHELTVNEAMDELDVFMMVSKRHQTYT